MSILSVNAGSSSLKFALYPIQGTDIAEAQVTGNIEGLEPAGQPRISCAATGQTKTSALVAVQPGEDVFDAALRTLKELLSTRFAQVRVQAIAHRVVHGGQHFSASVQVTPEVLAQLATLELPEAALVALGGLFGLLFIVNPVRVVRAEGCSGGQIAGVPEDLVEVELPHDPVAA